MEPYENVGRSTGPSTTDWGLFAVLTAASLATLAVVSILGTHVLSGMVIFC